MPRTPGSATKQPYPLSTAEQGNSSTLSHIEIDAYTKNCCVPSSKYSLKWCLNVENEPELKLPYHSQDGYDNALTANEDNTDPTMQQERILHRAYRDEETITVTSRKDDIIILETVNG